MSRLTEKRKEPLTTKWEDVPTSYYKIKGDNTGVCVSEIPRLNKLGKLEDLEEQLGCPLEVVFKALGHWIYDEDGNSWYIEHYYQEHNVYQLHSVRNFGRIADKKFNTKDYKKTWFLKEDKSE